MKNLDKINKILYIYDRRSNNLGNRRSAFGGREESPNTNKKIVANGNRFLAQARNQNKCNRKYSCLSIVKWLRVKLSDNQQTRFQGDFGKEVNFIW